MVTMGKISTATLQFNTDAQKEVQHFEVGAMRQDVEISPF